MDEEANYIGLRMKLGEAERLMDYLTIEQRNGVLKADYVTSAPECLENQACFNIEVLVKDKVIEVVRALQEMMPEKEIRALPSL